MKIMTFDELRKYYTKHELSYSPGNAELRYKLFAPFFENLFENKVIYYEQFLVIVQLEDIEITPERFEAKAIPLLSVKKNDESPYCFPTQAWTFGGTWAYMVLCGNAISMPYVGWTIWPEADRVQRVEKAVLKYDHETALSLTLRAC